MTDTLAIAIAQINPTVGAIEENADRLLKARGQASAAGADLVVASELVVSGYPPEDLVLKPFFIDQVEAAVQRLAAATSGDGPALLVGSPWREKGKVHNAALLLDGGRIAAVRLKHDLPNYGVFDEKRVFAAGPLPGPVPFRGVRLGVMVCEDMWTPDAAECLQEIGSRDPPRPQRHALRARQARSTHRSRRRPRDRDRSAADLCEPGRRPGRAGVRRRLLRAGRRPLASSAAPVLPRGGGAYPLAAAGRGLGLCRRSAGQARRGSRIASTSR